MHSYLYHAPHVRKDCRRGGNLKVLHSNYKVVPPKKRETLRKLHTHKASNFNKKLILKHLASLGENYMVQCNKQSTPTKQFYEILWTRQKRAKTNVHVTEIWFMSCKVKFLLKTFSSFICFELGNFHSLVGRKLKSKGKTVKMNHSFKHLLVIFSQRLQIIQIRCLFYSNGKQLAFLSDTVSNQSNHNWSIAFYLPANDFLWET